VVRAEVFPNWVEQLARSSFPIWRNLLKSLIGIRQPPVL